VFSIVITERGGAQRQLDFEAPEVSIGRLEDNDVVLPRSNVSKRHARLVLKDDRCVLLDLKSTNGTYLNGRKIATPMMVSTGDKIYIGDFILALQDAARLHAAQHRLRERPPSQPIASVRPGTEQFTDPGLGAPDAGPEPLAARRSGPVPPPPPHAAFATSRSPTVPPPIPDAARAAAAAAPTDRPAPSEDDSDGDEPPTAERLRRIGSGAPIVRASSVPPRVQDPESGLGPATSPAVLAPSVRLQGALQTLMERLANRMDVTEPVESAFPSLHQPTLEALIDELANEGVIGPDLDRRFLTQAAVSEAVGLGPLDRLLNNRSVREVVVDGPSRILADLGGGLSAVSSFFSSARAVEVALQRLCARGGKDLTDAPIQELDLPDGSQVQVLLPPLARGGPLISVRCPPRNATSPDGLITEGMLTVDMLGLLRTAVQRRLNVLVVGPTSSGVSTLLSALAALSQDHERIIALQRVPSLAIHHPHVLSLNLPGAGDRTLSQLLRHAARLRGDRLVIDDVLAEDALGVLTGAAATRGVIAAMHAPSPAAAVEQLELFAQLALGGARAALAPLIAQAFQLLVHVCVDPGGVRRVGGIAEIRGARDHTLEVTPLYRYDHGFKPSDSRASFLGGSS
jgi:pilus assembly protein CpaF